MIDLQELMDTIGKKYVFNKESYPSLDTSSPEKILIFSVAHSILHMNKAVGALSAEVELNDHVAYLQSLA